jgi:DNA-binding CsgD family transcriptional regulator
MQAVFTPRERAVLDCICQAMQEKHIAEHLHIAVNTVGRHRTSIFNKTGFSTSLELMRHFLTSQLTKEAKLRYESQIIDLQRQVKRLENEKLWGWWG